MIKIDFEFETPHGFFRDALCLPDGHSLTEEQITAMQTERLNSWLNVIENPPVQEPDIIEIGGARYEKVLMDGQILLKPLEV